MAACGSGYDVLAGRGLIGRPIFMDIVAKRQKRELFCIGIISISRVPTGISRHLGSFAESGTQGGNDDDFQKKALRVLRSDTCYGTQKSSPCGMCPK